MAKKNGRDDPPKPQVAENEQMSDIILILDKMELILQAVSQIDKDGRYKTVPADKEHTNSFLKIDRYASMFENFLKNFWSQLKDPTRFGILSVKEKALDDPKVRQAIEDLAAGKKTDAVEEFLKQYEIVPRDKENQSINHQNQEEMAKENETQQQADQGGGTQQQPQYRYNESMINWEQLKNFGLSREELQERGLLDQMLRGYKTTESALQKGFISPYASKADSEDFVELIALYVNRSAEEWEEMLTTAGDTGRPKIEAKFEIVSNYMKSTWNIDLNELREIVLRRAEEAPNLDFDSLDDEDTDTPENSGTNE